MEIRRIPKDWEHPKDKDGNFIPMYGQTYSDACDEWLQELSDWESGKHPGRKDSEVRYYWDYEGPPPDFMSYFPDFDQPRTAFQIYENTSEGTPISPIFINKDEMMQWLLNQGLNSDVIDEFISRGGMTSTYITGENGAVEEEILFYDV